MKNKRRLMLVLFYITLVGFVYFTSSTLSKYLTTNSTEGNFTIGEKLYFDYTRGDLFRGDQLIIGVPIEEQVFDKDTGVLIETKRRIETMNVAPGDVLKYHFTVSNVNEDKSEVNSVPAVFHVSATAILSMPVKQSNYTFKCTILYAPVNVETGVIGTFTDLPQDMNLSLPKYEQTTASELKYAFQVYVILDDQVTATSKDDYVGATLSIYLFIDAANV